jgi:asparagine synthase (glutamine-hydrolysing)
VSALTITGEVRLDNRDELFRTLDVGPGERRELTDLALILLAYGRWGEACPEKLLGDFAFAIHDTHTGRTFGARDHLGVKPFYYRASDRGLAFAMRASAIGAIDGLPLDLNERRVADVCVSALECVDLTSTFYLGVYRLPAGHRLTFDAGRATVAPYWKPDPSREIRLGSDAEYVDAFREVFTEAVRCRLAGKTASMLSGGLDSSAIVGFARAILEREPLTTLSGLTDDPGCEESRHIRAVLGLPGIDSITLRPGDIAAYRGELDTFFGSMEEPFDSTMMIPLLVYAAARHRGVAAVLDGVDGDTVATLDPDILTELLRAGRWTRAIREARGFAGFYRGNYAPWSSAARLIGLNACRAFAPHFIRTAAVPFQQRRDVRDALGVSFVSRDCAARTEVPGRLRELSALRERYPRMTARERRARELVHPQLTVALERYHRVAASQGIEARHPFLDRRVVEFCLALPWDQKVRDGWSKWIVRQATAGLLPESVRFRRNRWLNLGWKFHGPFVAESRAFVEEELSGDMSALAPYADRTKLRQMHDRYRHGDGSPAETLWTAAALSFWLRKIKLSRYDAAVFANGPATLPYRSHTG